MKNIKERVRGNEGVALEFIDKKSSGEIYYANGLFTLDSNLKVNGSLESESSDISNVAWDDLRVSASTTTGNGSIPPTTSLFKNDNGASVGDSYALSFKSTDLGNLTIPYNAAYTTNSAYSIEFWVKPNVSTQTYVELVGKENVFNINWWGGNTLAINYTNLGFMTTSVDFDRGSWNHIAMVITPGSSNKVSLYVNGQLSGNITSAGTLVTNTNPIVFNRDETIFDIDYIAWWNKSLSVPNINSRYNSGDGSQLVGNETNLVGLWELNDSSGTSAVDKTTTLNTATISGGTEGFEWDWINGKVGNATVGSKGVTLKYFSPTTRNEVYFEVQMPHSWLLESYIEPHVHWVPNSDGVGDQTVRWGLEHTWSNVRDVFDNTTIVYSDSIIPEETLIKNKHYISDFPEIDGTGKGMSSMLICRLFRDSENTLDTFPDFAGLLEVDFHYQIDGFGSHEEYIK